MEINIPVPNLIAILPEIILSVLACVVLIVDLFIPKEKKYMVGIISLIGVIFTLIISFTLIGRNITTFSEMVILDGYAIFFKIIFLIVDILTILISLRYLEIEDINFGEYYSLILFASVGMMVMAAGGDMISIYIGMELMGLSSYVLAGFMKNDSKSNEGCLKYYLMGIFTSGIILYGIALLYGLTGTTNLNDIAAYLSQHDIISNPVLMIAIIWILAGFGFKISAVPFHMWTPDTYEGSPTPIASFLSVGSKGAAFASLLRIFAVAVISLKPQWETIIWILSVITMTIGNVTAVTQINIKRMLAYSSIAQAGYILIGLTVATDAGFASMLLYLLVYTFMNIGAFSIVVMMCRKGNRGDKISDFTGLAKNNPYASAALVIFLLSLAGIPPTSGFVGKFYILSAAIESNFIWLAIIGVINSAISVYYYLRVVMVMYMKEPETEITITSSPYLVFALSAMCFATVLIGIYPRPFIEVAKASIMAIM
ncbi:MAG: NADH-quinone oxidoreductase subunit N [Nitrospirota bacterium]